MKQTRIAIAILLTGLLSSCSGSGISKLLPFWPFSDGDAKSAEKNLTMDQPGVARTDPFLIGAGIYDITGPAAEVGMMGYSMPDQKTTGIHMRLRSRAYIIGERPSGKRVVIVSAELCMISQAVKQRVVRLIQDNPALRPHYSDANILISASHTHSGPGGYSHYTIYDLSILGFIKENFTVITDGIYQSIALAHENLEPGSIQIGTGELENCGWNRSIDAYNNNSAAERSRYGASQDKTMTLLKLTAADGREVGMINWFAIHPTSIGNSNRLITGDNKGLAMYLFEKDKGADYLARKTFVGAFAQTNSGDISPNIYWGYPAGGESDFEHMNIIARRQYDKAVELYQNAGEYLAGSIDYRHAYVDFTTLEIEPQYAGGDDGKRTCYAAVGFPQIAGSTEDGKGLDITHEGMAWGDGSWPNFTLVPEDQRCHAEKIILLPAGRMKPHPWVPQVLPIQVVRIGSFALVGVPMEVTTMAGRRLRETVLAELQGLGVTRAVIASHANAYASYLTTREEYATQHYEGGSTQFGPYTLNAIQQVGASLAVAMRRGDAVNPGPAPADLSNAVINLQTGVVFDDIPLFKKFGDISSDASSSYNRGTTARVVFWGGHPKNNSRIQDTFLAVDRYEGGRWITIARDSDPETRYTWTRDGAAYSKVTIEWRIPASAVPGQYRFRHFGDWKSGWTGKISAYTGTSRTFTVR